MSEAPRSNRPIPRTPAAVEAELRRRIRQDLEQARSEAEDGDVGDAALAAIIARAVSAAVQWHLEAPEHTRNATLSSRSWRAAGGPRGGRSAESEEREFAEDDRPPRPYPRSRPPRDFPGGKPPRQGDGRPARGYDRPAREDDGPRREYDRDAPRDYDRGPRQFDRDRPPRAPRQGRRPPPRGGGFKRGGGGGFRSRRPK